MLRLKLAQGPEEIAAAQRLRYDVFVTELGASTAGTDHSARLETDPFDAHADHLLLCKAETNEVIGVTRLLLPEHAQAAGRYSSANEFDLGPLMTSGKRLLELSRTCLHPSCRGGLAMHRLWQGLGAYVDAHDVALLFGVASFHGTDINQFGAAISLLQDKHLAPAEFRVTALQDALAGHDPRLPDVADRRAAMRAVPSLIKAYLRLGATMGQGAFIDHAFNTTDICIILDPRRLPDRQAAQFRQGAV